MSSSSSGTTNHKVAELLKKTSHYDKDERYMATSDLCEVLKKQTTGEPTLDSSTERQICTAVLRLLHDQSNDVQAVAVKTLGVLLTVTGTEQVLEIADSLADQVLDVAKSELRDVYAIGLRTLVKTCPATMGDQVAQRLLGRLLDGCRSNAANKEEIVLACLDILSDLLGRFGATAHAAQRQHEPVLTQCLQQLQSESPLIRKRAGHTLACLSVVLSDPLLQRMVESLLRDMAQGLDDSHNQQQHQHKKSGGGGGGSGKPPTDTRSLIRTMCQIAGVVGHRLGQEQIDRILPIFLRFTDPKDAVTGDDDDADNGSNSGDGDDNAMTTDGDSDQADRDDDTALANELRESCFAGFESFILKCQAEVEPHLEKIITASLAYASYDPNYSYGDGGDEAEDIEEDAAEDDEYDDEEDEYEEEDEDEDDDDDESWKVRRSAIRALAAVIEAKRHDPEALWTVAYPVRGGKSLQVSKALVQRFKEREENCRVGVLDCFTLLLNVTVAAAKAGTSRVQLVAGGDDDDDAMMMDDSVTAIDLQKDYAPALVKACEKILAVKKGNDRSKSSALALLAALCKAPGGVGGQSEIASVFKHVQTFLSTSDTAVHREGTSKALRLDALSLVHALLASNSHNPVHVRQSLCSTLLPELCSAVQEQWYKVVAESLRALSQVPRFFVSGYTESDAEATKEKERGEVAAQLYTAIEPLLAAHDVDQEIKECALKACAALLSSLHASLSDQQCARLLSLLLDRLKNETTRIAAIKTLASIAAAESGCSLASILGESVQTLASFQRLQSRSLKQSALEALDIIVQKDGAAPEFANGELYSSVLRELAPHITDRDLHLSQCSLRATVSILSVCPAAGPAVKDYILEPALLLSTSSLLQDLAQESLLELYKQIILSKSVEFEDLLGMLRQRLTEQVSKTGVYTLAKCIAVITANTSADNRNKVLSETFDLLEGSSTPEVPVDLKQTQMSILITGDTGRLVDLSAEAGKMKAIYVGFFESPSEDLRNAASHALGNAAVGAPATFLKVILAQLDEDKKKQQYLLLSSLREFIQCSSRAPNSSEIMSSHLPVIVPPLEKHCSEEEEGVRTMVSECLGSLAVLNPDIMLKKLAEIQEAHSAMTAPEGIVDEEDTESKKNALVCRTVASSIKLAIAGKIDPSKLSTFMPTYVKMLQLPELHVRNASLLMIYSAVHHMPPVVSGLLKESIMPSLYEVAKLELKRKIDLGPFSHTVDDALPLRKAALSIFASCIENLPGYLDITEFMPVLAKALGDAEDIQLHAHSIVISMCARQPTYIVNAAETFVEPLEKTINKKPGQKTGPELDRLNEWIKSALRVMMTMSKLEGVMASRKFADFVERVKGNSKFTGPLSALEEER